jgi:hypothetical protein
MIAPSVCHLMSKLMQGLPEDLLPNGSDESGRANDHARDASDHDASDHDDD